jgi:hypothetical protein
MLLRKRGRFEIPDFEHGNLQSNAGQRPTDYEHQSPRNGASAAETHIASEVDQIIPFSLIVPSDARRYCESCAIANLLITLGRGVTCWRVAGNSSSHVRLFSSIFEHISRLGSFLSKTCARLQRHVHLCFTRFQPLPEFLGTDHASAIAPSRQI